MALNFVDALAAALDSVHISEFDTSQFTVLRSDALQAVGHEFLTDVQHIFETFPLQPNMVEFLTSSGPVKLTKPGVFECDLADDVRRSVAPRFQRLLECELPSLADLLRSHLAGVSDLCEVRDTSSALRCCTVKLQQNVGGSFPWHYDNPGRPNKRRLTLAFYLTENWSPELGGDLVLMPFLGDEVRVSPALGTVVLFRSDTVLHSVEPVRPAPLSSVAHRGAEDGQSLRPIRHSARYCFTVWFDGTSTNTDDDVFLKQKHLSVGMVPFLKTSPLQRILSRAVYDEEYRESLVACFGGPTSRDAALSVALHKAHLQSTSSNSSLAAFVTELRALCRGKPFLTSAEGC